MKAILHTLALALLLASCSCETRLERLRDRCPDCFDVVEVPVSDTVIVPQKMEQFALPLTDICRYMNEPLGLHQRDITLEILQTDPDTVRITAHVAPDTVIVTRAVRVPVPTPSSSDGTLPWVAGVGFALLMIWFVIHDLKNNRR